MGVFMRLKNKDWCKNIMNFADLKTKEIISVTNGKRLGYPDDVVLDTESNSINYFVILKNNKMFKKPEREQVPFSAVTLIGEDVILVKTPVVTKAKEDKTKETEKVEKNDYYFSPKIFSKK